MENLVDEDTGELARLAIEGDPPFAKERPGMNRTAAILQPRRHMDADGPPLDRGQPRQQPRHAPAAGGVFAYERHFHRLPLMAVRSRRRVDADGPPLDCGQARQQPRHAPAAGGIFAYERHFQRLALMRARSQPHGNAPANGITAMAPQRNRYNWEQRHAS